MRFFTFLALLAWSAVTFAQDPADIFHKTIDLADINEVSFDVYADDQFEVRSWPGDDILIETSVKLNNGDPHVLKFFLGKKRYDLGEEVNGDQLKLASVDKVRRQVKDTEFTTSESVSIVVYMPEAFSEAGGQTYRRASR